MWDEKAHLEKENKRLEALLACARKEGKGYLVTRATSKIRHASDTLVVGHRGYLHPRSRCQAHTTKLYHSAVAADQDAPVTCKRCLASLAAFPPGKR